MAPKKDYAEVIKAKLAADAELAEAVASEFFNTDIAMKVYEARQEARLSQKELAAQIGTHQSVISRIEDADYEGHSLALLKRIARALGKRLRVEFSAGPIPAAVPARHPPGLKRPARKVGRPKKSKRAG